MVRHILAANQDAAQVERRRSGLRIDLVQRPRLLAIATIFFACWLVLAIHPVNRDQWLDASLPVFAGLILTAAADRWRPLSDASYAQIGLLLLLMSVGAHYSYDNAPLGLWLGRWLGSNRNEYDRVVHFGAGLLLAYPVRDNLRYVADARRPWVYALVVALLLGVAAMWEIVEVLRAGPPSPEAIRYLGMQGDVFDAQHDMMASLAGSVVAMLVTAVVERRR